MHLEERDHSLAWSRHTDVKTECNTLGRNASRSGGSVWVISHSVVQNVETAVATDLR